MKPTLLKIIKNENLHAKWLNTLSYLEHIGSRKIMKSLNSRSLNLEMLEHLSEETRHSYFLKKILNKNFPKQCPTFANKYLLGEKSADIYFQSLDKFISNHLTNTTHDLPLNYYYVTLMIELRALEVYETYQSLLTTNGFSFKLSPLILEEKKHLQDTEASLAKMDTQFETHIIIFKKLEQSLFEDFLQAINSEITNDSLTPSFADAH